MDGQGSEYRGRAGIKFLPRQGKSLNQISFREARRNTCRRGRTSASSPKQARICRGNV